MKIEQDELRDNKKNSGPKTTTIVAVLITVTVIFVIGIIVAIMSMREKDFSVVVDGKIANISKDTFVFTEDR